MRNAREQRNIRWCRDHRRTVTSGRARAAVTLNAMGVPTATTSTSESLESIGCSPILPALASARVCLVAAGMDGALPPSSRDSFTHRLSACRHRGTGVAQGEWSRSTPCSRVAVPALRRHIDNGFGAACCAKIWEQQTD